MRTKRAERERTRGDEARILDELMWETCVLAHCPAPLVPIVLHSGCIWNSNEAATASHFHLSLLSPWVSPSPLFFILLPFLAFRRCWFYKFSSFWLSRCVCLVSRLSSSLHFAQFMLFFAQLSRLSVPLSAPVSAPVSVSCSACISRTRVYVDLPLHFVCHSTYENIILISLTPPHTHFSLNCSESLINSSSRVGAFLMSASSRFRAWIRLVLVEFLLDVTAS